MSSRVSSCRLLSTNAVLPRGFVASRSSHLCAAGEADASRRSLLTPSMAWSLSGYRLERRLNQRVKVDSGVEIQTSLAMWRHCRRCSKQPTSTDCLIRTRDYDLRRVGILKLQRKVRVISRTIFQSTSERMTRVAVGLQSVLSHLFRSEFSPSM